MGQKTMKVSFSRNQLKFLIAVTMAADHIGYMLIPPLQESSGVWRLPYPLLYYALRMAGRLAFPLVCFFLVQGMRYTHDRKKYLMRMILFALLSEIPFDLAIFGRWIDWRGQNVLFTLVIGLCVLYLLEKTEQLHIVRDRIRASLFIVAGGMLSVYFLRSDYSYWGILLLLVFYMGHLERKQRFWMMLILCACQGTMEIFAVVSLFFTENYEAGREAGKPLFGKYFFYLFYPIHFLVLVGIKLLK